jgi:arylsulfatase A-like enzyme
VKSFESKCKLNFVGYWTGHQDYFDHTAVEGLNWGLDMRRNMEVAYDLHGSYSTDVFAKEAVNVINSHNSSTPLFLYLAHAAVHAGNPYNPLPAPDETVEKFDYITDYKRQRFAAIMSKLDDSVGAVVNALAERNMLENSVIIFSTDNGGAAAGYDLNAASNYPLKGGKNTLWEGGVRGAGLLWSPLIKQPQRVARQFVHISDWLPTLLSIAGGNVRCVNKMFHCNFCITHTVSSNDFNSFLSKKISYVYLVNWRILME